MVDRKFIFLDIDGVLNYQGSNARCGGFLGIDDSKVEILAKIVKETGAKIILVSTWKEFWFRSDKDEQDELANYLDRKLKRHGLKIIDKTYDHIYNRGQGISNWLYKNVFTEAVQTCSWIVIDDEVFEDYDKYVGRHLVKTSFSRGLTWGDADVAIAKLNGNRTYDPRVISDQILIYKAIEIVNKECLWWKISIEGNNIVFAHKDDSNIGEKYTFKFFISKSVPTADDFIGRIDEIYKEYNADETAILIYRELGNDKDSEISLIDALEYSNRIEEDFCDLVRTIEDYFERSSFIDEGNFI